MKHIKHQQTLVLVKPDGVMRGLVGEIIQRIERRGLKVVGLKMVQVDRPHLDKHFPSDETWVGRLGDKGLKTFAEYDLDPKEYLGTDDRLEIGKQVRESLFEYMTMGPVVAMVVEGLHAIDMVRKLAGHTLPVFAEMGTIRGDFSVDSPAIANTEKRSIYNVMHASETPEEATNEIGLWFKPEEIHSYRRAGQEILF
jgi:nucleoside-diphosphate kinase